VESVAGIHVHQAALAKPSVKSYRMDTISPAIADRLKDDKTNTSCSIVYTVYERSNADETLLGGYDGVGEVGKWLS
jgi:hypothetical protein